jgi:hypothetical protein
MQSEKNARAGGVPAYKLIDPFQLLLLTVLPHLP